MKDFLVGAATATHQVEGNNIHSNFQGPSQDAVDHYNRYAEDIKLLADAGLTAYRFSIEWARIEPEKGQYDEAEIEHYRKVLQCCHDNGVTTIVTLHHFSSPKWLVSEGGWGNSGLIEYFKNYCVYVAEKLGDLMEYVCTTNEANMGMQIAAIAQDIIRQMGANLQVGMNFELPKEMMQQMTEAAQAFGIADPGQVNTFLSMRTKEGAY